MQNNPIIIEKTYNAPVAKVWKALADKNEMRKWYFDVSDFKPEVGFEFQFSGKGSDGTEYVHLCKVTEAIPNKKIAYTWVYRDLGGDSLLTFELFDESDKTRVKLTHAGLETFPSNLKDFTRESFMGGWNYFTSEALPKYLESN
jgi:uncharacterized protein YndB with AHSA1/START domain